MVHQVALYLFKNKSCSLPGVGSLKILQQPARYIGIDQRIEPPVPYIAFSNEEGSTDIVEYLASRNNISLRSANIHLESFCEKIKGLSGDESIEIPAAGRFAVDQNGEIVFLTDPVNPDILPIADSKTIVRSADHSILVGDVESNATRMTEYYSETVKSKKAFWKIWAAVLFIIAGGFLAYHFIYLNNKGIGNSKKFPVNQASPTYNVSQP